ncbi:MAG: hypothetical protein LBR47_03920 [Spirochaetaceae bacterium]|jgi:hypothetical protein|nr:hypothetical protein [Spirochaetaceae bacterium]
MKKRFFWSLFFSLAILGGVMLSGCNLQPEEDGFGILKLTNNSSVRIIYVSIEHGGSKVAEADTSIYSGSYRNFPNTKTGSYTVYVEDSDGDGYVTRSSVRIKKDAVTEVEFIADFKAAN